MTFATTVAASTPLEFCRYSDTSGTTATDSSGNSRAQTYNGGFTLDQAGPAADSSDRSVLLNGTSGYVSTSGYTPWASAASRTFMIAYKRVNHSAAHCLFSSSGGGTMLRLESGSQDVKFFPDTGTASVTWTAAGPGDGVWTLAHLLFDDSAHTAELVINGVSQTQKTGLASMASASGFVAGARGTTTDFFNGNMSEQASFSGLLSVPTCLAQYNALIAGGNVSGWDTV